MGHVTDVIEQRNAGYDAGFGFAGDVDGRDAENFVFRTDDLDGSALLEYAAVFFNFLRGASYDLLRTYAGIPGIARIGVYIAALAIRYDDAVVDIVGDGSEVNAVRAVVFKSVLEDLKSVGEFIVS